MFIDILPRLTREVNTKSWQNWLCPNGLVVRNSIKASVQAASSATLELQRADMICR